MIEITREGYYDSETLTGELTRFVATDELLEKMNELGIPLFVGQKIYPSIQKFSEINKFDTIKKISYNLEPEPGNLKSDPCLEASKNPI